MTDTACKGRAGERSASSSLSLLSSFLSLVKNKPLSLILCPASFRKDDLSFSLLILSGVEVLFFPASISFPFLESKDFVY